MNAEQRVLIIDSDLTLRISMYPVNQMQTLWILGVKQVIMYY